MERKIIIGVINNKPEVIVMVMIFTGRGCNVRGDEEKGKNDCGGKNGGGDDRWW